MLNKNRRLFIVAMLAALVYTLYIFLGPSMVEYPLPEQSRAEVFEDLNTAASELGINPIDADRVFYSDTIANQSLGRYVAQNEFDAAELQELEQYVPLFTFEVDNIFNTIQYDLNTKKLTSAEGIQLEEEADAFVANYFGEDFTMQSSETDTGFFAEWDVKKTYIAKTDFDDIIKVVDVQLEDDVIIGFDYYGVAHGFPIKDESTWLMIVSLFILIFMIGLIIFVTIHLIIRLVKKQVEAFWAPLILTVVAGFGWFFITKALGSNITGIGALDPAMMTYLTFATLLIRWKKDVRPLTIKVRHLQPAVIHGFLAMLIAMVLGEAFFYVASYFDTWVSPVISHNMLINLDMHWLPVFTLFIGLSAAVTEEAIFRNYMIPIFDRVGVLFSVILTSVLWGIMHIGYDMYPWYLYVVEFIFVTGPFFYFVYKRYGFAAGIFMHYFYNAWVTTLFLFAVDVKIALISLAVMLSPFLVFLIRGKEQLGISS